MNKRRRNHCNRVLRYACYNSGTYENCTFGESDRLCSWACRFEVDKRCTSRKAHASCRKRMQPNRFRKERFEYVKERYRTNTYLATRTIREDIGWLVNELEQTHALLEYLCEVV